MQATRKAAEIRAQLKISMHDPLNVVDSCLNLGIDVRFVEINMEGMYVSLSDNSSPTILLSSLRPLPRRLFTCAHELGHHVFNHGSKVDEVDSNGYTSNNEEERLVDMFAGCLLMPIIGIQSEFIKRNWNPENVGPIEFFTISSIFGTGYSTLVKHCRANKLITSSKAELLLKQTPSKLLKGILGNEVLSAHFKIIDKDTQLKIIDLEVDNYIFLEPGIKIEGDNLKEFQVTTFGRAYRAIKAGIVRAVNENGSCFIRIQNAKYVGLAEYRHLEN